MKVRLPGGAVMSLDALVEQAVSHEAAREALLAALRLSPLGELLIRYLAMHRPAQRELSFDRVATLLGELLPMIQAQAFERAGVRYEAPMERWLWGVQQLLDMREREKVRLPLKGHGLLLEVMTSWVPASTGTAVARLEPGTGKAVRAAAPSQTLSGIESLAERARAARERDRG